MPLPCLIAYGVPWTIGHGWSWKGSFRWSASKDPQPPRQQQTPTGYVVLGGAQDDRQKACQEVNPSLWPTMQSAWCGRSDSARCNASPDCAFRRFSLVFRLYYESDSIRRAMSNRGDGVLPGRIPPFPARRTADQASYSPHGLDTLTMTGISTLGCVPTEVSNDTLPLTVLAGTSSSRATNS
jgi:hypothetical protein